MRDKPKLDLGLTAYDELFKDDKEIKEGRLPKIYDIPIELIDDFPDHPFKVRMDEDMQQLVESVKERGLIHPIVLQYPLLNLRLNYCPTQLRRCRRQS